MGNSYADVKQGIFFNKISIGGLIIMSLLLLAVFLFSQYKSISITAAFFGNGWEGYAESATLAIFSTGALSAAGFAFKSNKRFYGLLGVALFAALFVYGVSTIIRQNTIENMKGKYSTETDKQYKIFSNNLSYQKEELVLARKELTRLVLKDASILDEYKEELKACKGKKSRAKKDRCSAYEGTKKNQRLEANNRLIAAQKKQIVSKRGDVNSASNKSEGRAEKIETDKAEAEKGNFISPYSIFSALKYDGAATLSFSGILLFLSVAISLYFKNMNLNKNLSRRSEEDGKNFKKVQSKLSPTSALAELKQKFFDRDMSTPTSKNKLLAIYKSLLNSNDIDEAFAYGVSVGSLVATQKKNGLYHDWAEVDEEFSPLRSVG